MIIEVVLPTQFRNHPIWLWYAWSVLGLYPRNCDSSPNCCRIKRCVSADCFDGEETPAGTGFFRDVSSGICELGVTASHERSSLVHSCVSRAKSRRITKGPSLHPDYIPNRSKDKKRSAWSWVCQSRAFRIVKCIHRPPTKYRRLGRSCS